MADPAPPSAAADRRSQLVAAALVGLVVLVLGFGSGIGAVFERERASVQPTTPGATTGGGGVAIAATPTGGASTGAEASGSGGSVSGSSGSRGGGLTAAAPTTTATTHSPAHPSSTATTGPSTTTPTTGPTATPPDDDPVVAAGCDVAAAMASPLLAHLQAAHLQTSPGDQVSDALDVDDYALAHTALFEAVLSPIVSLALGVPDALGPFWTHLQAAHLQTSPGDQVSDALDVDDYLVAHTVLVQDMVDGPMADAFRSGSC